MAPTKMMKWGMSVHEVKWKVRVGCSFSRSIGLSICFTVLLNVTSAPSTFGVEEMYRYISPNGTVHVTNVPSDRRFSPLANKRTYHASIRDQELEDAVGHYAEEYRLSPALVMAVIKAESDFNPIVISKAGAVGLMQLIPETAIQHGVRNPMTPETILRGEPDICGIC